jgi:hypothetical protein
MVRELVLKAIRTIFEYHINCLVDKNHGFLIELVLKAIGTIFEYHINCLVDKNHGVVHADSAIFC